MFQRLFIYSSRGILCVLFTACNSATTVITLHFNLQTLSCHSHRVYAYLFISGNYYSFHFQRRLGYYLYIAFWKISSVACVLSDILLFILISLAQLPQLILSGDDCRDCLSWFADTECRHYSRWFSDVRLLLYVYTGIVWVFLFYLVYRFATWWCLPQTIEEISRRQIHGITSMLALSSN